MRGKIVALALVCGLSLSSVHSAQAQGPGPGPGRGPQPQPGPAVVWLVPEPGPVPHRPAPPAPRHPPVKVMTWHGATPRDRELMERMTQQALERSKSGVVSTWTDPDTGHGGSVVPVETWQASDGTYCREYQQTITIGGQTTEGYGTACRQPDGSWQIVG